jgi:hypothetical protein
MMDSMNKLQGMRTYLAGAMDRVPDGGCAWRRQITPYLINLGVSVIDPCKKPIGSAIECDETRHWIEYYKETKQYDKIRDKFGILRTSDLRCIDICDFIVAQIDLDVHACGTYEEIVTANRQKKPIMIWCKQGKQHAPNWLFFMLPHQHIFDNMEQVMGYLHDVDSNKNTNNYGRWIFFDKDLYS